MITQLSLRPAISEDESFIFHLSLSMRESQQGIENGNPIEKNAFLLDQFAKRQYFIKESFPFAMEWIIKLGKSEIGYVLIERKSDEIRILELVIKESFRNHGIGTLIIRQIMEESINHKIPIKVKISNLNPASRLMQRLGFKKSGDAGFFQLFEYHPISISTIQ